MGAASDELLPLALFNDLTSLRESHQELIQLHVKRSNPATAIYNSSHNLFEALTKLGSPLVFEDSTTIPGTLGMPDMVEPNSPLAHRRVVLLVESNVTE